MKHNHRKGFTKVELIVVIAVAAILAVALISTLVSMNKQADRFADYQDKTNQQIADLTEQLENGGYLTAEQVQDKFAEELAKLDFGVSLTEEQVDKIVKAVVAQVPTNNESLSEAQVKAIINDALKKIDTGLTEAEIKALIQNALNGK